MADETVVIKIELQKEDAEKVLKSLDSDFQKSGKKSGENFGEEFNKATKESMTKSVFGGALLANIAMEGIRLAGKAIREASQFIGESITASQESEAATNALNAALASNGNYTKKASQGLIEYAESLQKTTRFEDDAIVKSMSLLESLTGLTDEGLKKATKAAMDMSIATGKDLDSAIFAIAKSANGSTEALSKMGIKVKEGANNAETFSNVLTAINGKFGGRSEADVNTYAGRMAQLSNSFGDLKESIGSVITKSPLVVGFIKTLTELLVESKKSVDGFSESTSKIGSSVAFLEGLRSLVVGVSSTVELVINIFKKGFFLIETAWYGFLDGVIGDSARRLSGLFENFDMTKGMANSLKSFADETKKGLDYFSNKFSETEIFDFSMTDKFDQIIEKTKQYTIEAANVASANDGIKNSFANMSDSAMSTASIMQLAIAKIAANSEDAKKQFEMMKTTAQSMANGINQALTGAIVKGVEFMVASIAKGNARFSDFAKSILTMWADISIQVGQMMIATGLGMLALQGFGTAGAAIAAGIGLVALGAIAKAFIGAGTGQSATSAGGMSSDYVGTTGTTQPSTEPLKQEQKVSVVVNGNIFDSRETGLRIVEILNNSFETDGSRLVTV